MSKTGGEALVESIKAKGVEVVFGIPGVQLYHLMDAFYKHSEIKFIVTRHEQGAAYMADGYARASGKEGVCVVVPGPGLLNASAAIGTAYSASSPVLVLTGQINKDYIALETGELHEIHEQLDVMKPITKSAERVVDASQIEAAVERAFYQLRTGRPRPVEIEVPPDTFAEEFDDSDFSPKNEEYPLLYPKEEDLLEAAKVLSESKKTIVWVGGGVISAEASEALTKLVDYIQSPVFTTQSGKGGFSDSHPLSMGSNGFGTNSLGDFTSGYDVVLAVGTRFHGVGLEDNVKLIQIDVDDKEIGRNYPATVGINADAKVALDLLYPIVESLIPRKNSRHEEVSEHRKKISLQFNSVEPQASFLKAIRKAVPDDGIVVQGVTQIGYYSRVYYEAFEPRSYITSNYFGNLGYVYPTALGAKVACPDKAVVAISGDGGFLFNSQELATAVKYGINAVVLVFNDNAFGNVKRDQSNTFSGNVIGSELLNPDFVKLAESYGAMGIRVADAEELEKELTRVLEIDRNNPSQAKPVLIEIPVGPMPQPW